MPASHRRRAPSVPSILAIVLATLAVAWLAIRRQPAGEPSLQTAARTCFRVGYLEITASAPLFVARDRDLFSQHGVCIYATPFGDSDRLVDALAADRLDYVVETSAVPALALEARDPGRFSITAASRISEDAPFDAILVRDTSGITSLSDLAGRRIAVFPGTTDARLLRDYLGSVGVDTAGIEMVPTPPASQLASLRSGVVDAAHVFEPFWTIGLSEPGLRELFGTVFGRQLAPNPQGVSLLNARTARRSPDESAALVSVFDSALALMDRSPDDARATLAEHFDLPRDAARTMHLLYMDGHARIDWDAVSAYADLLRSLGELEGRPEVRSLAFPKTTS